MIVHSTGRILGSWTSRMVSRMRAASLDTWQHIPVLCYHRVLPSCKEGKRLVYSVTPEQLEAQLRFLAENGFVSLSLDGFTRIARGIDPPPQRSVLITFDDGFVDNGTIAWPIAKRYGTTINLFVCTDLVTKTYLVPVHDVDANRRAHRRSYPELWRSLSWDQVRGLVEEGVGIGLHGHTHRIPSSMPLDEFRKEIATGVQIFEEQLGWRPRWYAFPQGRRRDYDARHIALLTREGFEALFNTQLTRCEIGKQQAVYPRLVVHQQDDMQDFVRKIQGDYDMLGRVREAGQIMSRVAHHLLRRGKHENGNGTVPENLVGPRAAVNAPPDACVQVAGSSRDRAP